ncbi:Rrp42p [Bonamia ostreae]|uniref:Rrp42p n=1 Tax=Bonamia ostreae TaxID=126728 RepID=A0ABV2AGP5_9EUKA
MAVYKSKNVLELIRNTAKENMRLDGRTNLEHRQIKHEKIANGIITTSFGKTKCVVSIKESLKNPFPDKPNEGIINFSSSFNLSEFSQKMLKETELNSILDNIFKKNNLIDAESLCVMSGRKVWALKINADIFADDGNSASCAVHAVSLALNDFLLPFTFIQNDQISIIKEKSTKLKVNGHVFMQKMAYFENRFVLDPSLAEEFASNAFCSAAFSKDGKICYLLKKGVLPIPIEKLFDSLKQIFEHFKQLNLHL